MKTSALILLLSISALAFQTHSNFTNNNSEPANNYSSDSVNLAWIVEDQINFAKKNPGRTSFVPELLKENKRAEFSDDIFSFIYRQYISLSSASIDLKIRILAAIMFFLGITLIILIFRILKMKRESGFIHDIKAIKEGIAAAESGLISSNLNSIRKLLCANPVYLYDKIAKEPVKDFSKAAKELNIAKGELHLAAKIRSYQMSTLISSENNLLGFK